MAAKADAIKSRIVGSMMNAGARLRSDSNFQLVFERPWGGQVGAVLVGSLISSGAAPVVERLTFSIAEVGNGTRVVLDRYMVKTAAFGREEANPANNAPGLEPLQSVLEKAMADVKQPSAR